jgi:hypothetical protein
VARSFFWSSAKKPQDCLPDRFDNLRDDGVAESVNSVQPIGYPMKPSAQVGFMIPVVSG